MTTDTDATQGVRRLRQERQLSLEALGLLAELDASTISRLERGLVVARPETIVKLARALGLSARRMAGIVAETHAPGA